MSILAGLNTTDDTEVQEEQDSLGGFKAQESDVYLLTIDTVHVMVSDGGAKALAVRASIGKDNIRETLWMTSGTAKGGKNFYLDKKENKRYLPGFINANALCLLTVGEEVAGMKVEKKILDVYDKDEGKEVATEVNMLTDLCGVQVYAGIQKVLEDKTTKNDQGVYVPTGETRISNEIDKFFRASDKMTVVEIKADAKEPKFMNDWVDKWKDQIKDKTDKNTKPAAGGATSASGAAAPKKLFGAK